MKRPKILLALMAVVVFTACTRDGETIADAGQEGVTSMTPPELRLTCLDSPSATRAGNDVMSTQLVSGLQVDVFMRDATDGCVTYPLPVTYTTDGSGKLNYDDSATRLYWPRLLHSLDIYGVYPSGVVSPSAAFAFNTEYSFTVAADQRTDANYIASDLMTGFPSSPTPNVAPCTLNQDGDEGTVNLAFTHRLTKIIVNVAPSEKIQTGEGAVVQADIDYAVISHYNEVTEEYEDIPDTKYACITLLNVKRKIPFKVYDATSNLGTAIVADDAVSTISVGIGASGTCIIPPQTISAAFIQIDLMNGENVAETFYYTPASALTLDAGKVYTFNVTLDKPNLEVTVNNITPWGSGESDQTGTAVLQPTE